MALIGVFLEIGMKMVYVVGGGKKQWLKSTNWSSNSHVKLFMLT